jgi:hypothetical protein
MGSLDLLLTFLWSFVFGKGRCIWILWIGFWYPPFLVLLWFLVLFHLVWAPFLRFASGLSLILFFWFFFWFWVWSWNTLPSFLFSCVWTSFRKSVISGSFLLPPLLWILFFFLMALGFWYSHISVFDIIEFSWSVVLSRSWIWHSQSGLGRQKHHDHDSVQIDINQGSWFSPSLFPPLCLGPSQSLRSNHLHQNVV